MSVIRVQNEGPHWAAKALVDFLGPLLGDAIKQQQQRDTNRKYNALLGEAMKLANANQSTNLQPTNLFTEQGTDGWANALQQSGNSVLGQFDKATEGISPQTQVQMPMNTAQPTMTQADLLRNYMNLLGTPRFSHLDTAEAMNRFAPYMNAAEAQRVYELQKALGMDLNNASDWDEYTKILANGAIQGLTNLDTLKALSSYAQNRITQDRKLPFTLDNGGSYIRGYYDPPSGKFHNQDTIDKTLSPREVQAGEQWDKNFGLQQKKWDDTNTYNYYHTDTNAALTREGYDIQKQQVTNQRNAGRKIITGGDGKMYWDTPGEDLKPVIVNGKHIDAPQGSEAGATWNKGDDAFIGGIDNQLKDIKDEIKSLKDESTQEYDEEKRKVITKKIVELKQKEQELRQLRQAYVLGRISPRKRESSTQTSPDAGSTQVSQSNTTSDTTQRQQATKDNSPIVWKNETTGKTITKAQYDVYIQAINKGDKRLIDKGIKSQYDLDRELERQGYKRN